MAAGPKLAGNRRIALAKSFEDGGQHYHQVRPGYPAESVDWLLPEGARDAADIGAGTGKFTGLLLDRGVKVTAVDPSTDMLAQLRLAHPRATAMEGTAEATGLPGAAFDVVSVAQAWHWCDPVPASTELARILQPGGVLGLVWNQLDTSVPWVHRLSRIMHAGDVYRPETRPPVGPEFGSLESHVSRWVDPLTPADIISLAQSRSYFLRAGKATRDTVLTNLGWYLHDHLGHSPGMEIQLPYLTLTWRATKR